MTLLIALAAAETGVVDTAIRTGGVAERINHDVPGALECVEVDVTDAVALDEPFELGVNNGCDFAVEVRQTDCTEDAPTSDYDGCARLVVQPGGADVEGLPVWGGEREQVTLEWFSVDDDSQKAHATWEMDATWDGGSWDSGWDSGRPSVRDRVCGGCDGGAGAAGLIGLAGLLLVRRRS